MSPSPMNINNKNNKNNKNTSSAMNVNNKNTASPMNITRPHPYLDYKPDQRDQNQIVKPI